MLEDLASESPEVRAAAAREILAARDANVQTIAQLVEKYVPIEDRGGTAKDSILLLGKLHAADSAPILAKNLTFEVFYKNTKRPQTTEDLYPAVQALIDIGSPALRPVLDRMRSEDSEVVERTGAAVWRGVLGAKWASIVLEREISASDDAAEKARLDRVLRRVSQD